MDGFASLHDPALHHRDEPRAIFEDGNVRGGVTVDDEDVRQLPSFDGAELVAAAHDFAFVNRGDEEALAHGERLLKLYPELVEKGKEYAQAKPLVADLVRRKAGGTFGKPAADKLPAELAENPTKAVTWLVAALDEVDARQQGQPGGVELGNDWRVKALITIGEPAVPALIDAVEKDDRFTRSVHFWRDFARTSFLRDTDRSDGLYPREEE